VTDIASPTSRIAFVFAVLLVVGAMFASGLIGVGVGMLFATLTNQSKWLLGPLGAIVPLICAVVVAPFGLFSKYPLVRYLVGGACFVGFIASLMVMRGL